MKNLHPETPLISQFVTGCILALLSAGLLGGSLLLVNNFLSAPRPEPKREADGTFHTPSYREAKRQVGSGLFVIFAGIFLVVVIVVSAIALPVLVVLIPVTGLRLFNAELSYRKLRDFYKAQLELDDNLSDRLVFCQLADVCQLTGRYEEAEPLYKKSLQISEVQLGSDHPDTASSCSNLANLYWTAKKNSQAELLYRRALQINEAQLGRDNLVTATSLNDLANVYCAMERYQEAESLYTQALDIAVNCLGDKHPDTKVVKNNLRTLVQQAIKNGSTSKLSDHRVTQEFLKKMRSPSDAKRYRQSDNASSDAKG